MADYIVTIRTKDGSLAERDYTANDRAELFQKLAADGVTAVRVSEGVAVKKPRKAVKKAGAPSKWRGLLAAAIVVLGAGLICLSMMKNSQKDQGEAEKSVRKSSLTIETNDSSKVRVDLSSRAEGENKVKELSEDEKLLAGRDTNEWVVVTDPNTGKKHLSKLMRTGLKNQPPPYFKHSSLNIIDAIQYCEMGDPLIGVQIDDRFVKDFQQALLEKIVIEAEDDEDRAAHKKAMIETLNQLKSDIKNGGDIRTIVNDALAERRRVAGLKDTMREERRRMRAEGVSEEEVAEFERACNQKLEELGARPMLTKEYLLQKGRARRNLLGN